VQRLSLFGHFNISSDCCPFLRLINTIIKYYLKTIILIKDSWKLLLYVQHYSKTCSWVGFLRTSGEHVRLYQGHNETQNMTWNKSYLVHPKLSPVSRLAWAKFKNRDVWQKEQIVTIYTHEDIAKSNNENLLREIQNSSTSPGRSHNPNTQSKT